LPPRGGCGTLVAMPFPEPLDIDCILLAAGESLRMGRPKQLLELGGKPLILHALQTALAACRRVFVVQGAVDLAGIIPAGGRVFLVSNPDYRAGQLGSLQRGLEACSCGSAFIMLADLPLLAEATYRRVAAAGESRSAAYPVCEERRGHPVYIAKEAITILMNASPDRRAMRVIAPLKPAEVEVEDSGIFLDADTPESWEQLRCRYRKMREGS
jgi:molybdenum cofactor cytidylyltransferase